MPKKINYNLIVGSFFLAFSFVCLGIASSYWDATFKEDMPVAFYNKNILTYLKAGAMDGKFNLISKEDFIGKNILVKPFERMQGANEKERKEGHLWVDRTKSRILATLGSAQGLMPGDYLTVYDHERKIGRVKIETTLDVTSYVTCVPATSIDLLVNDYYRVVIE